MESIKKVWAKMKEHKKASIIGAAVIVVLLIVIAVNNSNVGYTVDLNQIYELSCSGYEEDGTAHISSVSSSSEDDLIKNILLKLYSNTSNDYIRYSQYEDFFNNIKFEFNKEDHISNGDEIIATASYDKTQAKNLKLKFKNTVLKITASGLDTYIIGTTEISDALQSNLDQKAKEEIDRITNKNDEKNDENRENPNLVTLWKELGGMYLGLRENITLVKDPELKARYLITSKSDSKDLSSFIYIYEVTISGPTDAKIQGWDNSSSDFLRVPTETSQQTAYISIKISNIKIDKDNILDCNIASYKSSTSNTKLYTYKSLDEAKEGEIHLDQDKYNIKEL